MRQKFPSSMISSAFKWICGVACLWIHAEILATSDQDILKIQGGAHYQGKLDRALTLRRLAVFPVSDNLGGIYARPIEEKIADLVKGNHHWEYTSTHFVGAIPSLEDLERNAEKVKALSKGVDADAFIIARVIKGPKGVTLHMDLFLTQDGQLLAQERLKNHNRFELAEIKAQTAILFKKLIRRIPYSGLVLSRTKNNRVTLNLGRRDGVQEGQTLSAIQIISVARHPKFDFIISTQKEALGKIKLLKVEDTLSFGIVVSEKERGVITRWTKLSGLEDIAYPTAENFAETAPQNAQSDGQLDNPIAFEKGANEWLPRQQPSFGQVVAQIGLGSYSSKASLSSEGLDGSTSLFPEIRLAGEFWINPNWMAGFEWNQGIASTDNPRSGSTPESLSHALSSFSLYAGYHFLLKGDFFGPKVLILAGFANYKADVDSSSPTAFTSVSYGGFLLGLRGKMPVTKNKLWSVGLGLNIILGASLSENPVTSGTSSSNTVNDFKFLVERKIGINLTLLGSMNFQLTRASFTGTGTRGETVNDASQRTTTLSGGIAYLF